MKVIGCQIDSVWENKEASHHKVRTLLNQNAPPKGALVVLPEMFATGFSMNVAAITDSSSRVTQDFLARTANDYGVYLTGGIVTTDASGKGRNESVTYSPDGNEIARYCKIHPFTLGGELQHYVSGSHTLVFNCEGFNLAPFICYDLRFPEIFRVAACQGANLFTVIASWPAARIHHWVTLLRARAIENQAYVIGVNRCGDDPKNSHPGNSLIIDPRGHVLAEADSAECTISAELDLPSLLSYRKDFPFLNDIHADYVRGAGAQWP